MFVSYVNTQVAVYKIKLFIINCPLEPHLGQIGQSTFEVGIQQCQVRTINFFITFYLMITCVTTVINKAHLIVATFGLLVLQLPQLMAKLKKKKKNLLQK